MDKETRERFERIETNLERVGERMGQLTESHIELEAAQRNTTMVLNKFIEEARLDRKDFNERLEATRILLDELIRRDMNRE